MGPGTQVSQLEIGWFSTFLLAFGTTSYQCIGDIGTISYLLLKRYSSFLAMIKPKILVTGATGNSLLHHLESTTMNELFKLTRQHYEKNETEVSLLSKVTKILESLPDGSVDSSQLAGLDQFHVMGLAATEQLAQMAAIERGSEILDAGSGLGGPSRYLAGTYGCRVIGVDLSPSFVAVAQLLAQKAGCLHSGQYPELTSQTYWLKAGAALQFRL